MYQKSNLKFVKSKVGLLWSCYDTLKKSCTNLLTNSTPSYNEFRLDHLHPWKVYLSGKKLTRFNSTTEKLLKILENEFLLVMGRISKKYFSTSLTSFIVIQQTLNFLAPFAMALVYLRHCKINTEKKFKIKLCCCKCGRMVSFSFFSTEAVILLS